MNGRSLTLAGPRALDLRVAAPAFAAVLFAGLVGLQYRLLQPGLLYPDGYQYLLMARGIGQHLVPVATLGPHGDRLAPSADASLKPLFPALVALTGAFGFSPIGAARFVTALGSALVAPLCGLVVLRLGAGRVVAAAAAGLCLTSPALRYWTGFPGPDGLALALGLGSALALLSRRPALGGVLVALCVMARPEYLLPAGAALVAAAVVPSTRPAAARALPAGLLMVSLVFLVLRPPLALNGSTAAAAGLSGSAWSRLAASDWPLLVLAAAGLLAGLRSRARVQVLTVAALGLLPALAYWLKNPGSERYLAQLVPAIVIIAVLGLARTRALGAGLAVAAIVAGLVLTRPAAGVDVFPGLAAQLERFNDAPLVTAAPDAYGVLLPGHSVRVLRPGVRGLVLLDAAARAYHPELGVRGRLVARLRPAVAFIRPDGRVDSTPALLFRGRVVRR